jgi:hypothetical protein
VEEMLRAKEDIDDMRPATWEMDDFADFAGLRYPVYLPILEKMVVDEEGDVRVLRGITHNSTPEATVALFRLMKNADNKRLQTIASALCDRLPVSRVLKRPTRADTINPIAIVDADPELVKPAWHPGHAIPMRRCARELLTSEDPELIRSGAFILEAIGTRDDLLALLAAANRLVHLTEIAPLPLYIGYLVPIRVACSDVIHAIEMLTALGVEPVARPQTPGEIIHFMLMLKQRKDFRPANWEKLCRDWVQLESPFIREFVLFNTPRPVPDSLLVTYRTAVRKLIAATNHEAVIHNAVRTALQLKIPVDEVLGMLVDRLNVKVQLSYPHLLVGQLVEVPDYDEVAFYHSLYNCLFDLIQTGKHDQDFLLCTRFPDKKTMAQMKANWKRFLKEYGPAIRNGKVFDLLDKEVRDLLYPESF